MGYPMAGHLLAAGHSVTVYNRTTAKADKWVKEFGGSRALTPKEAPPVLTLFLPVSETTMI